MARSAIVLAGILLLASVLASRVAAGTALGNNGSISTYDFDGCRAMLRVDEGRTLYADGSTSPYQREGFVFPPRDAACPHDWRFAERGPGYSCCGGGGPFAGLIIEAPWLLRSAAGISFIIAVGTLVFRRLSPAGSPRRSFPPVRTG